MRRLVGKRLPKFSADESKLVKGSFDFLGLNYYTSSFAANANISVGSNISYSTDSQVLTSYNQFQKWETHWSQEGNTSNYVYPKGILDILLYTKNKCNNPTVYITENGLTETGIQTVEEGVKDYQRANFYRSHLKYLKNPSTVG